ncbi:MAG: serine/threonine protein kinase [Myxococcales bacterium]|nr:serine/threonine protein kinase [Myxococcales bacterium]
MTTSNERAQQKDPLIGTVFAGRYKVERRLGRGGMGLVYRATQTNANRKVVLKVLAPDWIGDPEALARFEREARGLSALQHPNIVAIHDYGSFDGRAYIVMEYVAGETLERFVKRKGQLSLADFVPIAAQVLKGLGEAHSRGIIHRDIKPANIMLCERQGRANYVKILDFGLAKLVSGSSDITKQNVLGTPTCLSPEQIKGEKLDQRVDVYAVGILFYYMLAGVVPFAADNDASILYKHVHEKPEPLVTHLSEGHQVPEGVIELIERCLKKTPSRRPRDANEVVEGLIDQVPFSMFKLPRAEPKPPGFEEEELDEPYQEGGATGEQSGEAIPGPQDIQVGTFGRAESPSGQTPLPTLSTGSGSMSAAAAAAAAAAQLGSSTGPLGANPLGAAQVTGAHSALGAPMMNPAMTYPPGAFPQLDAQNDRSRNGMMIVGGVVVFGLLALLFYMAMSPREILTEPTATQPDDAGKLEAIIAKAERSIAKKDYYNAETLLDGLGPQLTSYPELFERRAELKGQIEVGKLLEQGRTLEDGGKTSDALQAYRNVLAIDSKNSEAKARIAALSGNSADAALGWLKAESSPSGGRVMVDDNDTPLGLTPLDPMPIAAGSHQITILLDDHLPWKKSVTISANKTFPINAVLTPKKGVRKPPPIRPTVAEPEPEPEPEPAPKPKPTAAKKKKKTTTSKTSSKPKGLDLLPVK